jgi:hypothetical protein
MIRTPDQRLRVFVSSTLDELALERAAAKAAISQLRLTPVLFESGARPHPPRALYRAYLAQSDIFIGLYWQRYGWVAPAMPVSGLEDEYESAGEKPKLIYVKTPRRTHEAVGRNKKSDGDGPLALWFRGAVTCAPATGMEWKRCPRNFGLPTGLYRV